MSKLEIILLCTSFGLPVVTAFAVKALRDSHHEKAAEYLELGLKVLVGAIQKNGTPELKEAVKAEAQALGVEDHPHIAEATKN